MASWKFSRASRPRVRWLKRGCKSNSPRRASDSGRGLLKEDNTAPVRLSARTWALSDLHPLCSSPDCSERIAQRAEDAEAHAILSGVDSDAAAIAQLVTVVGHVYDIHPGLQKLFPGKFECLFRPEVHRVIIPDASAI